MSGKPAFLNLGILHGDVEGLKSTTSAQATRIQQVETKVASIEKSDVGQMATDVQKLKSEFAALDTTYATDDSVSAVDSKVTQLGQTVESNKTAVEGRVTTLEQQYGNLDANFATDAQVEEKVNAAKSALEESINAVNDAASANTSAVAEIRSTLSEASVDRQKIETALARVPTYAPDGVADQVPVVEAPTVKISADTPISDDGVDGMGFNGVELKPTVMGGNKSILSVTTSFGGIAIDKAEADNRWVIERNTDDALKFHMNDETNAPFVVDHAGIKTPRITVGTKTIVDIADTVINEENIKTTTVPSTKAIVAYINANVAKKALADAAAVESVPDGVQQATQERGITEDMINGVAETVDVDGKQSVLVRNASAISFNVAPTIPHTSAPKIVTIHPSIDDGLKVNNKFKLSNDSGILCSLVNASQETLPSATTGVPNGIVRGKYVEFTGNVIAVDDMYILEVRIPTDVSATICGIIDRDLTTDGQKTYTHNNAIHELPDQDSNGVPLHFITIHQDGIHLVQAESGSYAKGSLLAPSKDGKARQASEKLISFCTSYRIPMAKVIANEGDFLVAMLV